MIPTQRIVDRMIPEDRKQLPKQIRLTSSERQAKNEAENERKMHNQFSDYLRLRKQVFQFVHANPTKRSTIKRGWPDYTVICKIMARLRPRPVACLIEFKVPGGKLSPDQIQCFNELEVAGIPVYVV